VTLQTSNEENEILLLPKDQKTQNKQNEKTKQKVQNRIDKENDQKLITKNTIHDQIFYDMFMRSGLTMENVLKFREDQYKTSKVNLKNFAQVFSFIILSIDHVN